MFGAYVRKRSSYVANSWFAGQVLVTNSEFTVLFSDLLTLLTSERIALLSSCRCELPPPQIDALRVSYVSLIWLLGCQRQQRYLNVRTLSQAP